MKLPRKMLALAALVSLVALILPSTALAGPPASARGSGHVASSLGERVFTFSAVEKPNGTVKGQGQLLFTAFGPARIHFAVDCLDVDGDTATMSGVITDSNFDELFEDPDYEGGPFWVRVVDNGEGANSPADEISLFAFDEPGQELANCNGEEPLALPTFEIERGNVQVKG